MTSDTYPLPPRPEARETELKFDLSAEEANALVAQPPWTMPSAPQVRTLHSVYFDTPDHALRRAGFTLRIRAEGGRRTQTVKTLQGAGAALTERGEWSCPATGDSPDLQAAAAVVLEPVLGSMPDAASAVGAVFSVTVQRHVHIVACEGASIEIAIDFGELQAGDRLQAFYELELELLDGDKQALFALAHLIFSVMPLRLQLLSKAERGFTLLQDAETAARATPVVLAADMPVAQAFQTIAHFCLRQLIANEAAFRRCRSVDSVHQARVAIRRLRAAMMLFRKCCRDEMYRCINAELRWIAAELGKARALDVYIDEVLEPAAGEYDATPDYRRLMADYRQRRQQAYRAAAGILASSRFRYAMLALAEWIECGSWLRRPDNMSDLRRYAGKRLARCWKRVRRVGARYRSLDHEKRHAWRIDIKKLRYACEFFSSLYDVEGGSKHDPQRQAQRYLGRLQDWLGTLNDIAETECDSPLSDVARALQRQRNELRPELMRRIDEDYVALEALLPFWKSGDGREGNVAKTSPDAADS